MKREQKKGKINNKVKWLIFLLIFLMVLIMVGLDHFTKVNRLSGSLNSNAPVGIMVDSNAGDCQTSENDGGAEQNVAISGVGAITIPANQKEIPVNFYNPKQNAELYYLTFELRLYNEDKAQYEVLCTSGLVSPGNRVYRMTLSHGIEKGKYDAVVHIQPYRMNRDRTPTNNVDIKTKLIVE